MFLYIFLPLVNFLCCVSEVYSKIIQELLEMDALTEAELMKKFEADLAQEEGNDSNANKTGKGKNKEKPG